VHLALALWVFWDCLAPGLIPYGRDTVAHDVPFFTYGWETLRVTGVIPLWNHQLFAGWPWVAAAGWTPWYPPHWIALAAPISFAFTSQYVLHHAWAGLGFTLWCRALGLRFGPALLGGALFQMSGHFTTLVFPGHLAKFEAIAWMPWVMAAALQAMSSVERRGSRVESLRLALCAAVCLAMQILTQHAQIVYYTAGLMVALVAWRVFSAPRAEFSRPLIAFGLVVSLAAGLAFVQLLPATEMIRISNRAEGVSFEEATSTSYPPRELVELLWPGLFGSSVDGSYHGGWNERLVSDYLGVVTLLGVLIALTRAFIPRKATSPPHDLTISRPHHLTTSRASALLVLIGATLLLALGSHTPLYRVLYDWLPGWDRWRSPATIMVLSTFGACTLAALGWAALLAHVKAKRSFIAICTALIVASTVDEMRVARRHVIAIPAPEHAPVQSGSLLVGTHRQAVQLPIRPFSAPLGRAFLFTQEYSNALMTHGTEVITGYHPILLQRYQQTIETMTYINPNFHRLLGVTHWARPPGQEWGFDFPVMPLTTFGSRTHLLGLHLPEGWSVRSLEMPGEMLWSPETIDPAESPQSAREALRAFGDSRDDPFAHAVIQSPGVTDPISQESTSLGSEMIKRAQEGWLHVLFSVPESTRILWDRTHPAGLGHENNALIAEISQAGDETRWWVLSQIAAPGWVYHTGIEDEPLGPDRLGIAWDAFVAVKITGGAYLEGVYSPTTTRLGLFVSLASLAVVLALLVALPKARQS
jgi:hypothetical protein